MNAHIDSNIDIPLARAFTYTQTHTYITTHDKIQIKMNKIGPPRIYHSLIKVSNKQKKY